ncbi:hypothetical protein HNR77_002518 [Paenibacillus sp. JGP012]|uniref:gas vesicle accessory protein GvpU n=1 Tax=Paenibacillus sp. JGP012 TaxID=2735914 RepID=UPI001608FEE8|nr:gas vesicle accessory protein GvpU [Paenibacillus sp. JGP012]MBB6021423.1 hypothetical protein [Paenibacillus sp. JGP012]
MSEANKAEIEFPELTSVDRDFTLENLVRFANIGYSVSITLNVNGTLISGLLTSGKDYMETVAQSFEGVSKQGDTLASVYRGISESMYSGEALPLSDLSLEFVHLKEAVIFQGNTDFNVGYWRGKINSVDGFSIGKIKK